MVHPEEIKVKMPVVCCDGGGGALGHPLVYLSTGESGVVDCPYCGKRYVLLSDVERTEA